MTLNLNSVHPTFFKLFNASLSREKVSSEEMAKLGEHFPTRKVPEYTAQRQVEHLGVAYSVSQLLGHKNWHLLYSEDGAPKLYEYHKPSKYSISISHSRIDGDTIVFVATSDKNGDKIGLDLTSKGDPRLERIAPRTMNDPEIASGKLEEIWALKEAMFKAYGPGIDFKDEINIYVDDLLVGKEYVRAEFRGKISTWWVANEEKFVLALGPCEG